MKNRVTLTIPILNADPHSMILWSLTLCDDGKTQNRVIFNSTEKYYIMENIFIHNHFFEKIIFDFHKRRIQIINTFIDEKAIRQFFQSITIHSSKTSKLICLYPPTKPKAENN